MKTQNLDPTSIYDCHLIQAKETYTLIGSFREKLGLISKDKLYSTFEDINVCKTTKGNHKSEPKE